MDPLPKWLPDAAGTAWEALGEALRAGLPVPGGFIIGPCTPEHESRAAYEQLKILQKIHFVAVRGATHAVLNVIGADPLVQTLRRLRAESVDAPILVQRMVHAIWSGKAQRQRNNLWIKANEGLLMLDPDTYIVNTATGRCTRSTLEPRQRKMIRHVDGSTKTIERHGERLPIPAEHLAKISQLAAGARSDIRWAIDDSEKVWLISTNRAGV